MVDLHEEEEEEQQQPTGGHHTWDDFAGGGGTGEGEEDVAGTEVTSTETGNGDYGIVDVYDDHYGSADMYDLYEPR